MVKTKQLMLIMSVLFTFSFSNVYAAEILGDVNGDNIVNMVDIGLLVENYDLSPPNNPKTDINNDGKVNIIDIGIVIDNYGKTYSTPTPTRSPTISPTPTPTNPPIQQGSYNYINLHSPSRVEVRDKQNNWLATFTMGSRTVALIGASRTFSEKMNTSATITHSVWIRTLQNPFTGIVDENWLKEKLVDNKPDILQTGMDYVEGGPKDASYGPVVGGVRQEGSDFNDYLGISWTYPNGTVDPPEANQIGSMDCSGFIRYLWGYKFGLPLTLTLGIAEIPRRAVQINAAPIGTNIIQSNSQITDFSKIQVGDIVFFDADSGDGPQVDHMGMYMGIDSQGHYRFLSSRKTVNGPTIGDTGGLSIFDGTNLYARSFRSIKRF